MRRRIRGILMSGKQFSLDSRMDLVQGYACCRPAIDMSSELPLQEDEDSSATGETGLDANRSNNGASGECSTSQQELQGTTKAEKLLKKQNSKARSNYVNDSRKIGPQDCSNDLTSLVTTEANLPRSETIAAIGHH